ncbi:hypothetical protein [Caulobacter henricii]|uniref:Uncharacterized protein n=1 Tax=Caulobacter henricii TaxID=69395 RepID=A0A0P0P1E8_9CAUL|nr:hypothetical protein [Caulobacter henricii]ALL14307.1 hypothetical protein AQ619_13655 [Caulobacter henricii]
MTSLTKSVRRMLTVGIALSALCAGSASAKADSIVQKLNERNINYTVSDDNYIYAKLKLKSGRSQTIVISGSTQQIMGQDVRLMLSPVAQVPEGQGNARIPLDPMAQDLLKNNSDILMGGWDFSGGYRYFQVKIIDNVDAATLQKLMLNLGSFADRKEMESGGERDQF